MRFCFLTPGERSIQVLAGDSRKSGGAEAQVARLAAAFAGFGHDVTIFYGSGGSGQVTKLSDVTCIDGYPAWRRPTSIRRFWRSLGELRPEIIYARLPDDFLWLAGLFAAQRPGTQFIYALAQDGHCDPWHSYEYKSWLHNPLYALGLRSASVIAVQHAGQEPLVRPHVGGTIVQIPNLGPSLVDTARSFAQAQTDVIWVAQIRPTKQLSILLDLAEGLPELRFAVVGGFDGTTPDDDRQRLQRRIDQLANLHFYGPQPADAVAAALRQSKVLVNTSSAEGFPNSMLEAWNLGVPVASLNADPGGVITRAGLGLVSGSVEQLAADLSKLCANQSLNETCGAHGVAYVRTHHSADAVYRAFAQVAPMVVQARKVARGSS